MRPTLIAALGAKEKASIVAKRDATISAFIILLTSNNNTIGCVRSR